MPVLRDANATAPTHFASTTFATLGTLTVGSNPNTVLIAQLTLQLGSLLTITSFQWDSSGSPQNMTLIGAGSDAGGNMAFLYGLLNPTPGNKTLAVTWTGGSIGGGLNATSYKNADTSVNVATTFYNFTSAAGNGTTASVTDTSGAGEIVVDCATSPNGLSSSGSQTTLAIDNAGSVAIAAGEQTGVSAGPLTSAWAIGGGSANWVDVACVIRGVSAGITSYTAGQAGGPGIVQSVRMVGT